MYLVGTLNKCTALYTANHKSLLKDIPLSDLLDQEFLKEASSTKIKWSALTDIFSYSADSPLSSDSSENSSPTTLDGGNRLGRNSESYLIPQMEHLKEKSRCNRRYKETSMRAIQP